MINSKFDTILESGKCMSYISFSKSALIWISYNMIKYMALILRLSVVVMNLLIASKIMNNQTKGEGLILPTGRHFP